METDFFIWLPKLLGRLRDGCEKSVSISDFFRLCSRSEICMWKYSAHFSRSQIQTQIDGSFNHEHELFLGWENRWNVHLQNSKNFPAQIRRGKTAAGAKMGNENNEHSYYNQSRANERATLVQVQIINCHITQERSEFDVFLSPTSKVERQNGTVS